MRALTQFLSALLVAAALLAPAVAKEKRAPAQEFKKSEEILKWINEYRRSPEPDRLPDATHAMGDLGLFRELDQAGVYVGFIAGVIGANPDKAERLVARMFPMPPEDQVVLIRAIAYSGLPDWKELLQKFVERMPARQVLLRKYLYGDGKTLREIDIDAYVIDALWGYFFATGSAEPIQRIVSILSWSNDKNDVEKVTIGSMAKWTLATNASRQKDLLDILAEEMNTQPAEVRKPLREVIEAAETFETAKIRKDAMTAVEELRTKGSQKQRDYAWWGQAGQTALALGCVGAAAGGLVVAGIPCVVGGAISGAALKYFAPEQ
jgi:hypothetical protein